MHDGEFSTLCTVVAQRLAYDFVISLRAKGIDEVYPASHEPSPVDHLAKHGSTQKSIKNIPEFKKDTDQSVPRTAPGGEVFAPETLQTHLADFATPLDKIEA
jgi:hypothetical protein